MSIQYNIKYKGETIHKGVSPEESTDILMDYAERYYTEDNFNINDLELEEIVVS